MASKDIYLVYELLLNKELVSFPITKEARNKIESLVSNINSFYFGKELYDTVEKKAVAYLYFIIKDHPFTDGNKRTACLVFEVFCEINGIKPLFPDLEDFALDQLAVFMEKVKVKDHQSFISDISELLFK